MSLFCDDWSIDDDLLSDVVVVVVTGGGATSGTLMLPDIMRY